MILFVQREGKKERESDSERRREGDRQSEKERSEGLIINYNEAFFKILNVSDKITLTKAVNQT